MNNPIVKILRFLIFLPICFLVIAIINWGLGHLFLWVFDLSTFWFIVIVIILGGTIWKLFKWFAAVLTLLAAYISPIKWLSTVAITLLALANGVFLVINIWSGDFTYTGWIIFVAIILSLLVVELTFSLISGAVAIHEDN